MKSKPAKPSSKRVLFLSDTHCGHVCGLTPPDYQAMIRDEQLRAIAKRGWAWLEDFCRRHGPFDVVAFLGDGIDGRAYKDEGREVICEPAEQKDILADALSVSGCLRMVMVAGTPYHVNGGAQWEGEAVKLLRARGATVDYGDRITMEVNGCIFDLRHKVGGSQAPTGGDVALRTEMVRSAEWAAEYGYPVPHQTVRGHVHRERVVGGGKRWARTLPALQLWTGFGARECGGLIHWGATICDVSPIGEARWHSEIRELRSESITPLLSL